MSKFALTLIKTVVLSGVICNIQCDSYSISNFILNFESNNQFHSVVLIAASPDVFQNFEIERIKTPLIVLVNTTVEQPEPFLNSNALFIVYMRACSLLTPETVTLYAKHMARHGRVFLVESEENALMGESCMEATFQWVWERAILQAAALHQPTQGPLEVYRYNPFPKMHVYNATSRLYLFDDRLGNLQGYPIRSSIYKELPRSFKYTNRNGEEVLGGYTVKVFLAFLRKHNGTLVEIDIGDRPFLDGFSLIEYVAEDKIDLTMNSFICLSTDISCSHPINLIKMLVLVPAAHEVDASLYNVLPFEVTVWALLLGTVLVLATVYLLLVRMSGRRFSLMEAFVSSVGVVIAIMPKLDIQCISWQSRLIFLLSAGFGIIMSSIYQSSLASFYTIKIYEEQIETPDEMIKANLTILVGERDWPFLQLLIDSDRLRSQFRPVSIPEMNVFRETYNTSFGNIVPDDKADRLLAQQMFFPRPLMRMSQYTVITTQMVLFMPYYTPYEGAIDRVILQCQEAGLLRKWLKDSTEEIMQAEGVKRFTFFESKYKPLILKNFQYFWILLFVGLTSSFVVFIIECVLGVVRNISRN